MQIGCTLAPFLCGKNKSIRMEHQQSGMKKIKYLTIRFKNELGFQELRKFRGAVIDKAGREHILFHNHQDGRFRYSYPLIQYKRMGKQAGLVCLEDGVHEVHAFFQGRPHTLRIGDREFRPEVEELAMKEVNLQVWDKLFHYHIYNWLALNQDHYREYQRMPDDAERTRFLTSILRGNLLSMAKGLDWFIEREVKVQLRSVGPVQRTHFKDQTMSAFHVRFSTNIWLPPYLGLGKGAALGYGMVSGDRQNNKISKAQEDEQRDNLPGGTAA